MKKMAMTLLFLIFLTRLPVQAQELFKFRYPSNPSFSSNNYKQPDRAALAKKYNLDKAWVLNSSILTIENGTYNLRNYKQQVFWADSKQDKPLSIN